MKIILLFQFKGNQFDEAINSNQAAINEEEDKSGAKVFNENLGLEPIIFEVHI
jgi:hypothetical protein